MSTETQDYSIEYQSDANAEYAALHGLEIVRSYQDAGISGLGIERRLGLKELLADVFGGAPGFEAILVYDVSRWGRFQNPDQAAHYEFMCQEAGVEVIYCAEPFANDGSPTSALLKHIKRAMAAEYSRELSVKVRRAKHGLRQMGYWQGSMPGYAFRREIVSRDGRRLAVRQAGEWGAFPQAHTRLMLGPSEEIEMTRRIYRLYLKRGATYSSVSALLNREGVPAEADQPWTLMRVRGLLTNPKYVGRLTVGKLRSTLGGPNVPTAKSEWVTAPNAAPAVVSAKLFDAVQRKISRERRLATDDEALDELRRVWRLHGALSDRLVRKHGRWSPMLYQRRFGSMAKAFLRVGYTPSYAQFTATQRLLSPPEDFEADLEAFKRRMVEALRLVFEKHGRLTRRLIDEAPDVPSSTTYSKWFGDLAAVYELVGFVPKGRQQTIMALNRELAGHGWEVQPARLAPSSANLPPERAG